MVQKSNNGPIKKEMPESIRKLFEQKQSGTSVQETNNDEGLNTVEANVKKESANTVDSSKSDDAFLIEDNKVVKEENAKTLKKEKVKKEKAKKEKLKNDKIEDSKRQETQLEDDKSNSKKLSKKTKITILSILLAVVCCAFVITLIVLLVPKANKMDAPTIQIYSLSNQTILHVDENEDAVLYEFYIQKKGETNIAYLSSQTNEVSIKSKLSTPGEYYIWARYGGKNSKETSNDSEKYTYYYYEYLDTPKVYVSSDSLTMTWLKVVNAKEYRVYYGIDDQELSYFTVAQPSSTTTNVIFDFAEFNNVSAGNYTLYVQAVADENNYYKSSELSQPILYANRTKLADVQSATYNRENGMLRFTVDTSKTTTKHFEIVVNENEIFGFVADSINEEYTFDLTPYLKKGVEVSSVKIKALGDGDYITDSEYITAGII